jgi:hypothetical protein
VDHDGGRVREYRRVGTEQTRSFRVTGDRLQEMTAWAARPDNRMARAVTTYERAK